MSTAPRSNTTTPPEHTQDRHDEDTPPGRRNIGTLLPSRRTIITSSLTAAATTLIIKASDAYTSKPLDQSSSIVAGGEVFDQTLQNSGTSGINFTITNKGEEYVSVTGIRVRIEAFEYLQMCGSRHGQSRPSTHCYNVVLPLDNATGQVIDHKFILAHNVEPGRTINLPVTFTLPDSLFTLSVALYRIQVELLQHDRGPTPAGSYALALPGADLIYPHSWAAQKSEYGHGANGSKPLNLSRNQQAAHYSHSREQLAETIACYSHNDQLLRSILSDDLVMSPALRSIWDGVITGTYRPLYLPPPSHPECSAL